MKDNLKNVVITFSLIALVFTQGSLSYQKKIYKDYIATNKQDQLLATKKSNLSKLEQNRLLLNQIKQQELANQQALLNVSTTPATPSTNTSTAQADLLAQQQAQARARAQAQLLAQQKAKAQAQQQALAQAQAQQAQAQAQTAPSRQSSAS